MDFGHFPRVNLGKFPKERLEEFPRSGSQEDPERLVMGRVPERLDGKNEKEKYRVLKSQGWRVMRNRHENRMMI